MAAATSRVGVVRDVITARPLRRYNAVNNAGGRRWCQPSCAGRPRLLLVVPGFHACRRAMSAAFVPYNASCLSAQRAFRSFTENPSRWPGPPSPPSPAPAGASAAALALSIALLRAPSRASTRLCRVAPLPRRRGCAFGTSCNSCSALATCATSASSTTVKHNSHQQAAVHWQLAQWQP